MLGISRSHGVNQSYSCPYHEERHASFSINMEEGAWICFACGERGNFERLHRDITGREPGMEYLVKRAKANAGRTPVAGSDFTRLAQRYHADLELKRAQVRLDDYRRARGIIPGFAESFGVGFDREKEALAFPYFWGGRAVAIKYRTASGAKYSEPQSDLTRLYNGDDVSGKGQVVICEGESDTHAAWSIYGSDDTRGICGTSGASVSSETFAAIGLQLLFARRIGLAYDADEAGDRCAEIAMRVLGSDKCVRLRPTRGNDLCEAFLAGERLKDMVVQ